MRKASRMAAGMVCVCVLVSISERQAVAQQQSQSGQQAQSTPSGSGAVQQKPAAVDEYYTGDGLSINLFYWQTSAHPSLRTGHADTSANPSNLSDLGKSKAAPGGIISVPVGKDNSVRVSYFRIQGHGNTTSPGALTIFGTDFVQGDLLSTSYTIQNAKISLDYLSWPFPLKNSKFRLKTLWEVQATWVRSSVAAPLRTGQLDASGNVIQTSGLASTWFLYPSFGLGVDYLATKNLRFELRGSGFAFPHRSTIWDTEGTLNYRVGSVEFQAGGKVFHFKASPKRVEYTTATFPGIYVGVRFYPWSKTR